MPTFFRRKSRRAVRWTARVRVNGREVTRTWETVGAAEKMGDFVSRSPLPCAVARSCDCDSESSMRPIARSLSAQASIRATTIEYLADTLRHARNTCPRRESDGQGAAQMTDERLRREARTSRRHRYAARARVAGRTTRANPTAHGYSFRLQRRCRARWQALGRTKSTSPRRASALVAREILRTGPAAETGDTLH
jgi:hypothetical protein